MLSTYLQPAGHQGATSGLTDSCSRAVASSRERAWPGITLDLHPEVKLDSTIPARDHHLIIVSLGRSKPTIQQRAGQTHSSAWVPGTVVLMPTGYESAWYGEGPATLKIRLNTDTVDAVAEEVGIGGARPRELSNVFNTRDEAIERFGTLLHTELSTEPHPAQRLIVNSISCAMAAHLVRHYDTSGLKFERGPAKMGDRELNRVLEYINDHVGSPIDLTDLSALAGVSRFHFTVLFKRSTGLTAMAYVEQTRIKKAQELIRFGQLSLADIALAVGYSDQAHFTRRFARHTGVTPGAYANVVDAPLRSTPIDERGRVCTRQ